MNTGLKLRGQLLRHTWKNIMLIPLCSCVPIFAAADDLVPTNVIPPADIIKQAPDSFSPYASYGINYDSNLLGLQNASAAQSIGIGENLSDFTRRLLAGVKVDQFLSQQHLTANVNIATVNYDRFQELDHTEINAATNLNWHTGPHVEGNIGVNYSQGLTPFIDFHLLEKNIRTQESAYIDGSWLFHPSWRIRAGLVESKLFYDLASQKYGNHTKAQTEEGIDYLAASGSTLGLQLRQIHDNYPNPELSTGSPVVNSYNQNEIKAKMDWLITGKTRLHFLGGWVNRGQEESSVRDYSGFNERISADWLPTGKINVTVSAWREIGTVDDLSTVYSMNRAVSIGSTWQATEKLQLVAQAVYEKMDFSQSLQANFPGSPNQNEVLRNEALTLIYATTTHWKVQLSAIHSSQVLLNGPGGYANNGVALTARYAY